MAEVAIERPQVGRAPGSNLSDMNSCSSDTNRLRLARPRASIAKGTIRDRIDMERMGKKQELQRNFRQLSTISFTSCVMGT